MDDQKGVGTVTPSEVYSDAMIAGAVLPVGVHSTVDPGYRITHGGTCVRKPLRSSVEEEAKHGKLVYTVADEPNSPESLRRDLVAQKQEMEKLIAEARGIAQGSVTAASQSPTGTATNLTPTTTINTDPSITELRASAKEKGINTFQMGKAQIIEELRANS